MNALPELRSLSLEERLRLIEELWNSIAEDQASLPDDPALIDELRARKARFDSDRSASISWQDAKERIRSGRV